MAVFGTQLSEAASGLREGGSGALRAWMQVLISLALVGAGLYVLLTGDSTEATEKLAAGWIGAVVGYWLK